MCNLNRYLKLLVLLAGVAAVNVVVLSPGLMGVKIGGSPLQTASGVTLVVVSLLIVLYGSYTLLFHSSPPPPAARTLDSHEDYVAALSRFRHAEGLKEDIAQAIDQLERLEKRKAALLRELGRKFQPGELSYRKFLTVVQEVERLFYFNLAGVIGKASVFDAAELAAFSGKRKPSRVSEKVYLKRVALHQEYMSFIHGHLNANEEIMLRLDRLLLELSHLGNMAGEDIEQMPGMKEIEDLIKQTKFYQQ